MTGEIPNQVLCVLTMVMVQSKMHPVSHFCGKENFMETLRIQDGSFANISDAFNITKDSLSAEVYYDMCEMNSLRPRCRFRWNLQFNNMTVNVWDKTGSVICSAERHDLANSVYTVQLHVSQLVSRSMSLMELSYKEVNDKTFKAIRLVRLDVLYPPNITSFTVDGHEVGGSHVINDGDTVTVSCSYDIGNPPTNFRLLGTNGTTLNVSDNDGQNISHTFTARCEDEWPILGCKDNTSAQNRSVSFLVNCPPQFISNSQTVLSVPQSDVITLPVKSHTTAVSVCLLTSMSSGDNTTMNVTCTVSGIPPEFLLNLHLGQKNNSIHGNWTLTICNEKGSANTTLNIIDTLIYSGPSRVTRLTVGGQEVSGSRVLDADHKLAVALCLRLETLLYLSVY